MSALEDALDSAVHTLKEGGIVAYPTEAVYGLGCDAGNDHAIEKLIALKQRDAHKGLIIIAADYRQLTPFLATLSSAMENKIRTIPEQPTTWLVPASRDISPLLTGGRATIAIRLSQHPVAQQLCAQFGAAITSTSANPSGLEAVKTAQQVKTYFRQGQIDTIIDAPVGTLAAPTRIICAETDEVIR